MKLSVLIPVHNEGPNVESIYGRVKTTVEKLPGVDSWQMVYLNNASQDDTLDRILKLRQQDSHVKVITLSRNSGYHGSLLAGITTVESDLYAIVDGDGEDPPELLSQFYETIRKGTQIAYGIRSERDEPYWVTRFRELFYRINRWIADSEIVLWMGEFSMFTRQVRDAIVASRTTYPFIRAEMAFVGFDRAGISYQRAARSHGKTHFNFYQMTKFAVAGFLSSSTFPLRFVFYLAFALGVALPLAALAGRLNLDQTMQLSLILLFYFSLITGAVLALYLARTYKNGVARPVFIIDQRYTQL